MQRTIFVKEIKLVSALCKRKKIWSLSTQKVLKTRRRMKITKKVLILRREKGGGRSNDEQIANTHLQN